MFKIYKKTQALKTRWIAFGLLSALLLYGMFSFYFYFRTDFGKILGTTAENFIKRSFFIIPGPDLDVNFAFLVSLFIFSTVEYILFVIFLKKPKISDFLIEMESELKKVSWPTRKEYVGSSTVVFICIIIMAIFLLFVDYLCSQFNILLTKLAG